MWCRVKEELGERAAYRYQMDAGKRRVLQQEHRSIGGGSQRLCMHTSPETRYARAHRSLMRAIQRSFTVISLPSGSPLMPAVTHTGGGRRYRPVSPF